MRSEKSILIRVSEPRVCAFVCEGELEFVFTFVNLPNSQLYITLNKVCLNINGINTLVKNEDSIVLVSAVSEKYKLSGEWV